MTYLQFPLRAVLAAAVVLSPALASAQAPSAQTLVGTWNVTLTSPNGTHPATIAVTEDSGKLTGAVSGLPATTPAEIVTSEKGVTISFSVDYQGSAVPVVLSGTVTGTTMKGSVDYAGGAAAGEFEGTKAGTDTVPAGSASPAPAGVAGTWLITSDGDPGWTFELTQEGTAVSGLLKNAERGVSLPVKGTLENGTLALTISGEAKGNVKASFDGTTLKGGTYELNDSSGTWSATRKP